jgi:hypothetical protein
MTAGEKFLEMGIIEWKEWHIINHRKYVKSLLRVQHSEG